MIPDDIQALAAPVFAHPGLLHTEADFERMAQKVAAGEKPWVDGWKILIANGHSSLSYTPRPQAIVSRGNDGVHPDNSGVLFNDVAAAYARAALGLRGPARSLLERP